MKILLSKKKLIDAYNCIRTDGGEYYMLHISEDDIVKDKPAPTTKEIAQFMIKTNGLYIMSCDLLTLEEAEKRYGDELYEWPCGDVSEVPND